MGTKLELWNKVGTAETVAAEGSTLDVANVTRILHI